MGASGVFAHLRKPPFVGLLWSCSPQPEYLFSHACGQTFLLSYRRV